MAFCLIPLLAGCTSYHIMLPAEEDLAAIRTNAEAGNPYYQAVLAGILRGGEMGISKDSRSAVPWARKSADQEHPMGMLQFASLSKFGHVIFVP